MKDKPSGFVVDANVLIDYANSDITVLALVARAIGPVHIPDAVIDNVAKLDEPDCVDLGLRVVQPDLDQLIEAGGGRSKLAHDDWLCLILARDHGWYCVTNDKALRAECAMSCVEVLWGLEPLLLLVSHGELDTGEALLVAQSIHETNPAFITSVIVAEFERKLYRLAAK